MVPLPPHGSAGNPQHCSGFLFAQSAEKAKFDNFGLTWVGPFQCIERVIECDQIRLPFRRGDNVIHHIRENGSRALPDAGAFGGCFIARGEFLRAPRHSGEGAGERAGKWRRGSFGGGRRGLQWRWSSGRGRAQSDGQHPDRDAQRCPAVFAARRPSTWAWCPLPRWRATSTMTASRTWRWCR